MPAFRGGDHDRTLLLDTERRTCLRLGLRHRVLLDRLALAVETIKLGGDFCRLDRIVLDKEPHAQIGAADPPAGIDARAEQKAEMPGFGRSGETRDIHQAHMPCPLAPAQRDQSLGDKGAVETDQRHHVGDGAERYIVEHSEQIGFRPIGGPKSAPAQHAVDRDHRHESEPDGGEMAEAGEIVAPVRIDDRDRGRQRLVGLMVINDDDIEPERFRLGERFDAGGAAIDADEKRCAACGERAHRFDIRAIALEQPVRNVNDGLEAALLEMARQQRRRGRAVDVIVTEYRDAFAPGDRVGNAFGRLLHGGQHVRIGHRLLDGRIEECVDCIDLDVTAGEDARQQFGQIVALRDGERTRGPALVEAVAPRAPGRRILDAKE